MKIKSIRREQYCGKVYNIGTSPDHDYYANGILVHNCYQDSTPNVPHTENVVEKIKAFFGSIPFDLRPFQVAIGGGEPVSHPDFPEVLKTFDSLGIMPNYTTNGTWISDEILDISAKLCGGVAISAHPHLKHIWSENVSRFNQRDIMLCLHHVISDERSVDRFLAEMKEWGDRITYHVLLPLSETGRSKTRITAAPYLFSNLKLLNDSDLHKCAFGALFYDDLLEEKLPVSIYEPEAFSRYLDLSDMKCYLSSFDLTEKPVPHWPQ